MASATQVTWRKRAQRVKNMGRRRKATLRNHGSTPALDVHSADAVANAPSAQLRPADRKD
jgi:hypothetical protein